MDAAATTRPREVSDNSYRAMLCASSSRGIAPAEKTPVEIDTKAAVASGSCQYDFPSSPGLDAIWAAVKVISHSFVLQIWNTKQ